MNGDIRVNITKHIGVLSEKSNGWKKELNLVEWNGNPAKFDIRDWNEDHSRMSKGITLTLEEAKAAKELLEKIFC